jgi:plasmid maintenance system antidote protein VapI
MAAPAAPDFPLTTLTNVEERLRTTIFGKPQPASSKVFHDPRYDAIKYLISQIRRLEHQFFKKPLSLLNDNRTDQHAWTLSDMLCEVALSVQKLAEDNKSITIDSIASRLARNVGTEIGSVANLQDSLRLAVFAALGKLTTLYTPASLKGLQIEKAGSELASHEITPFSEAGRPFTRVLRGVGATGILDPVNLCDEQVNFPVSLLNIASLFLKIAGRQISVTWVANVRAHLDFHEPTSALFLFRAPSVCASYLNSAAGPSLFDL